MRGAIVAPKKQQTSDDSTIVKITDGSDGRVHFTARGSAAHRAFEKRDGVKVESVEDATGQQPGSDSAAPVPA